MARGNSTTHGERVGACASRPGRRAFTTDGSALRRGAAKLDQISRSRRRRVAGGDGGPAHRTGASVDPRTTGSVLDPARSRAPRGARPLGVRSTLHPARRPAHAALSDRTTDGGGGVPARTRATRELRGLRPGSATRPRPHSRSCSIAITACRPAATAQRGTPTAIESKRMFWKQKSPTDHGAASRADSANSSFAGARTSRSALVSAGAHPDWTDAHLCWRRATPGRRATGSSPTCARRRCARCSTSMAAVEPWLARGSQPWSCPPFKTGAARLLGVRASS